MLKRRSFLALLGIAPAMPALAATKAVEAAPIATETAIATTEATVMAKVAMPVKIKLSKQQVEFCEIIGMDIREYAKNLLELKRAGQIQGNFDIEADSKDLHQPLMSPEGKFKPRIA